MDRGNIPGFYYDEEKKKYFKIIADHLVPNNSAKYSQGKVHLQQRQAKKRKTEERKHTKRLKQTVKRSNSLHHPLIGAIGLQREQGSYYQPRLPNARDEALIKGWRPTNSFLDSNGWNLTFGHVEPTTQTLIYGRELLNGDGNDVRAAPLDAWYQRTNNQTFSEESMAFNGRVRFITTTSANDCPRMLVMNDGPRAAFYMGPLPHDPDHSSIAALAFRGNSPEWIPLTGKFQHATGTAVFLTTREASVFDQGMGAIGSIRLSDCVGPSQTDVDELEYGPSTDWLDTNTVVLHHNTIGKDMNPVLLWDTRFHRKGAASRFTIRERTTGILCPANTGHPSNDNSILVSTNHSLRLYDTRMPHMPSRPDRPLVSFPHVHEGPKLHFTTNGQGLVAAADRDKMIQVYSTRTGRSLGSPNRSYYNDPGSGLDVTWMALDFSKGLHWYEDEREGSSLLCFVGRTAVRWSWNMDEPDIEAPGLSHNSVVS